MWIVYLLFFLTVGSIWLAIRHIIREDREKLDVERPDGSSGSRQEAKICTMCRKVLGTCRIFRNVYVPTDDGFSEVDVIAVSAHGVWVFESKDYRCEIKGRIDSPSWQCVYDYKHRYFLYNPILQNLSHIKALCSALGLSVTQMIPVVVFSNSAEIHVKDIEDSEFRYDTTCVQMLYLRLVLNRLVKQYGERLTEDDVEHISEKLEAMAHVSLQQKQEHVERIKKKYGEYGICPRCGRKLVKRQGQTAFIDCSGFPKCRFTCKI